MYACVCIYTELCRCMHVHVYTHVHIHVLIMQMVIHYFSFWFTSLLMS